MTEKSPTVQRAARPGQRTGDTKGRETLSGPQSQFCCGLNPSFWGPPDCLEWDFSRTWKEATVRSHTGSEGRQEMKSLLQKFLSWSAAASPGGGGRESAGSVWGRGDGHSDALLQRAGVGGAQKILRSHPRPHLPLAGCSLRIHPEPLSRKTPKAKAKARSPTERRQ